MPKHAVSTSVQLPDGRTGTITAYDEAKQDYLVRPDKPKDGETRARASRYKEAEVDAMVLTVGQTVSSTSGRRGTPQKPAKARFTILQTGESVEVTAWIEEADGFIACNGHDSNKIIGLGGCAFDPATEIADLVWLEPEVVHTTIQPKETPAEKPAKAQKPAPVAEPNLPAPVASSALALPPELAGFQFITGEAVDGPNYMDTPRLQLAQGVGKSVELGWSMGDIMFADLVLLKAAAPDGNPNTIIGRKAGPVEMAFLRGDSYWAEDIPYEKQRKEGLIPKIARTSAERAAIRTDYGWVACVDYTFLVKKPEGYADPLQLFSLDVGGSKWALAAFSAREESGSAGVINAINTNNRMYLKNRPWAGKYTLSSEVIKGTLNVYSATQFRRVGVWDDATCAGLVEILKGFATGK